MFAQMENYYHFECFRKGKLIWEEWVDNLVVNEGLDDLLGKYLKGAAYTAAFYVGLIDNAGFTALAAGDTAAQIDGTNGWTEFATYTEPTRPALTLGAVSGQSVNNSGTKASFTIGVGGGTVNGALVVTTNVISGVTGLIYGEGSFAAARTLSQDDVLNVTITLTSASA